MFCFVFVSTRHDYEFKYEVEYLDILLCVVR